MKYYVTEVYKSGRKVYKGKAHRVGWEVWKVDGNSNVLYEKFLPEFKKKV